MCTRAIDSITPLPGLNAAVAGTSTGLPWIGAPLEYSTGWPVTVVTGPPEVRAGGLSVSCLNVDDVGVSALPAFPALTQLMPMDVPDAGYRHIGRCGQLESLILMYCRSTTDAATEHIVGLQKLSSYFNSYTTITDRTPELLSGMESLERITFDACHGLTNAGVARLARLPRLRELRIAGRGITSEGRDAFAPDVRVFCEG